MDYNGLFASHCVSSSIHGQAGRSIWASRAAQLRLPAVYGKLCLGGILDDDHDAVGATNRASHRSGYVPGHQYRAHCDFAPKRKAGEGTGDHEYSCCAWRHDRADCRWDDRVVAELGVVVPDSCSCRYLGYGLAFRYIPSHEQTKKASSLDLLGAGLFMLLVSSVIIAISNGNGWGWNSEGMLILFGGVLVLAWAFVWWERRQSVPFLPVAVFRLSAVSSGLFISFTSFVLANLVLVVLPFYLLDQAHVSPLTAGYMMTAYPLLLALTGPFSGWASDRFQARPLIFAGLGAMGVGMTVLAIWLEALSTVEIIGVLALVGAGMGLIASPNNSYIMRHVPMEHAGAIGGMIALTRNAGMVVGAALGLGMMNGESNQAVQPVIDAYHAVFEAGGLICLSGLLVWWYAGRLERQKKRGAEVEKA